MPAGCSPEMDTVVADPGKRRARKAAKLAKPFARRLVRNLLTTR